ncbi:hypothetical protein PYCCODRAFT_1469181 [Trametes coccinea BRFM310]|uniref:Uncharacterized protein n=1 Tax=Trametes coccinea (strain BRFM310) TaxID=1353009 RepID=A0A1Y2IHX5_TRAC3|nr:hypothetical protein PYCCODRAFT_1469181 [Trametes coccinea BRFM310]
MMHLLNFVLAALATSKAFAAPIEGAAAAEALIPETISGSVEARQLDGLPALGGLMSIVPVPSGILRRGLGDGSLEFDSLNIPMPTGGVPALNVRQGGPLDPVAAAPPRLPLPLSLIPAGGDAGPTGTQEIGAGGGGGGGGGVSFPNILVAKPAAAPVAAEAPAVEDAWHPSSPARPTYTYTWDPDYASYASSWWHQPSAGPADDVAKGPIPTGNSANIGGHNVNLPRADDPAPTAAPAASTDAPSWASWTDWQTWTSQWGQFSNAASAYSWTQTWDGAAAPTYTWPAWNGAQGQNQNQNQNAPPAAPTYTWPAWNGAQGQNQNQPPAAPTGAVRAAVAPGAVELPPKDMNAEVGKGAISASVAAVEAKATAA